MSNIWISYALSEEFKALANAHHPRETGGILLGYVAENNDVVVTKIIGPGPNAKHGPFSFHPDAPYQKARLDEHFYATSGQESYLGDWHTHPNGVPLLSRTDKRTLSKIALTPSSGISRPIMLVLAGGTNSWVEGAFRFIDMKWHILLNEYSLENLTLRIY